MSNQPRQLVLGVFRRGNMFLVGEGRDRLKNERFYRPLGGGIEPGEEPPQALVREMLEELGEQVRVTRHLGEIDNRFVYEGQPGWETVHVYQAEFLAPDGPHVERVEAEDWKLRWIAVDELDAPLYPEGLVDLLRGVLSD